MPSEDSQRVVKLNNIIKELTTYHRMNYSLRKENNSQKELIAKLQGERDQAKLAIKNFNKEDILIGKDNTIAELQEELRRCETSRRDIKRTMSNLILNAIICLDKGLPKAQRGDVIMKLCQFGEVGYRARAKFEVLPEPQPVEEKKLIADAAEATEKIDADELEAAAKENTDDAGK